MTLKYFIKYKIPFVWKWNVFHNPYYEWWKVRKYFKPPKPHILTGKDIWFYGLPIADKYYNKWITCQWTGLGWKHKYDEVRHEWDPMFWICWRRRWFFIIQFSYDTKEFVRNTAAWECIASMVYNHTTLEEARALYEYDNYPITSLLK